MGSLILGIVSLALAFFFGWCMRWFILSCCVVYKVLDHTNGWKS